MGGIPLTERYKRFNAKLSHSGGGTARPRQRAGRGTTQRASNKTLQCIAQAMASGGEASPLPPEWIARFGEASIRWLVQEAIDRKNQPAYRIGVLQLLRRIGSIADPFVYMDLFTLTREPNDLVREAALTTIFSLKPHPGDGRPAPGR